MRKEFLQALSVTMGPYKRDVTNKCENMQESINPLVQTTSTSDMYTFVGKGLPVWKKAVTVLGITGIVLLVLWIALHEGASAIVSTVLALLLISGFVWYLRMIAPKPFVVSVDADRVTYHIQGSNPLVLTWADITRIREEFFPNGKRIGVVVYRTPDAAHPKPKAFALYRDDLNQLDDLAIALKQLHSETCKWESETVHE